MKPYLIKIKSFKNVKGTLSVVDSINNIPFDIKRIFFVYDIPRKTQRGGHAHKKLKQFIWSIYGEIDVFTISKDGEHNKFNLSKPNIGLFLPEMTWSYQLTLKENSIYCVGASDYYEEDEYIRNWSEFKNY